MENWVKKSDSVWLAENVKVVDQRVKEMLLLIAQDNDFSMEKVDNHLKQPELIAHINEISHRHHLLADRYISLTRELHSHIQSGTERQYYEGTIIGSHQSPSLVTPVKKQGMDKVEGQGVDSDLSLSSSGGISDTSLNEGSEDSLLSSDSDSESFNSSPKEQLSSLPSGKLLKHKIVNMEHELSGTERVIGMSKQEYANDTVTVRESGEYETLLRQISECEQELKVSNQKLQFSEEEIVKWKSELLKNEAVMVTMGSVEAQLVSAKNQIKLYEAHIETENTKALTLQRQITEFEAKLESENRQVLELQEKVTKYTADLSDRELEIQKLCAELQDAFGNFAVEKFQLESCISNLSERLTFHDTKTEELQMQCKSLIEEIKKCEAEIIEKEKLQAAQEIGRQDDIERMKAELCKEKLLVATLEEALDGLKLKYDILMSEKNGVNAKLQTLSTDLHFRDNQIKEIEYNLHQLYSENARLCTGSESAEKLTDELKSRIGELEKEVERQSVLISDGADEKREAIRQLCFALEHYRTAYKELYSTLIMRKRPTV